MLDNFKDLIKLLFNRFGFQIGGFNKYKDLIREMEGLYRELVFKEFQPLDDVSLDLMATLIGTNISEAIYILHYLNNSLALEGDICEFGVAQGATSALMANEIKGTRKNIWLFDSFKGLPKPSEKDTLIDDIFNLGSIEAYEGTMAFGLDQVKRRLKDINFPFSRVRIVPGFIEETIKLPNLPRQICFAYIDFDLYEPISIALSFVNEVLQPNGFVVVDDYDFFSAGAKIAVEEFMALHKENYSLTLPLQSAGKFCLLQKIS